MQDLESNSEVLLKVMELVQIIVGAYSEQPEFKSILYHQEEKQQRKAKLDRVVEESQLLEIFLTCFRVIADKPVN